MAVREIKTTLTLDGERQFEQEIRSAASNLRVMGSEMRAASAEYGATGDKADYLAKKSRTLGQQLAQQKEIFEALKKAVDSSAQSTGEASSKTDGYRIRMNNAAAAVSKLERELRDTDRELEELGRDSNKVGRQIEEGIGDAAEEAARDLDGLYKKLDKDIGSIKTSGAVSAISNVGGTIVDIYQGLNDLAESSREYNRQMSYLEMNAQNAELSFGVVKDLLFDVASVTGDVEGAFEGVSNLIATGFDTSEMELAIQTLGGAVIAFPETMKFENLAESLQESIATGEATGAFAELLDRTNVSLEDFKNAMAAATTEEEKQQVALSFLHSTGLTPVYNDYKDINDKLIEGESASLKLKDAWAQIGETADLWITPMKSKFADALVAWNDYAGALGYKVEEYITNTKTKVEELRKAATVFTEEGAVAGAKAVGEVIGTQYTADELEAAAEASKTLREEYDLLQEQILEAYAAGDGVRAWEIQARINELQAQIAQEEAEAMTKAGQAAETAAEESGEAAGEALTGATTEAIAEGAPAMEAAAETATANAMAAAANGINENGQQVIDAAAAVVNAVNDTLSQMQMPDTTGFGGYYYSVPQTGGVSGGRNVNAAPTMQISLNVDGKKMASVVTPSVSNMQSTSVGRASALFG